MTMTLTIAVFFSGVSMLGSWIGGIYFFKFWKQTHDRLFFMFGIAFWLMALERLVLNFAIDPWFEEYSFVYLIRLFAFLVIICAIVDKNRKSIQD